MRKYFLFLISYFLFSFCSAFGAEQFVSFTAGDLHLNKDGKVGVYVQKDAPKGVLLAARNLCEDILRVCDAEAQIVEDEAAAKIVVRVVPDGRWEAYDLKVEAGRAVITGSDRRGAIYGIYELSRQIGVSPWYWWADVPAVKHKDIYLNQGVYTDGEPRVKYRGIFLNDEAPCLTTWVKNTYGTSYGDHRYYARVFELLLRLKANYIWPAMWGWAFYADDPLNGPTADEMGIMVGTSHHEPMSRSQKEWHNHSDDPNAEVQGFDRPADPKEKEWNYLTNQKRLDEFWAGGVRRNKETEDIITIGMRGDGDMAMSEQNDVKLLERIIKNQRKIIARERGKRASQVPQLWALYKEVQDYYDEGLRVPDDVTILLCDDNWGNVRRVPTAKERQRKGGWGLYYHVDYVGAPRNSKWLNVTPTQNMWEQLTLALDNGIERLWILNVGDLKPMEYQIDFFLAMAWQQMPLDGLMQHTEAFCAQQFGIDQAKEAARILNLGAKYAGRSTAEMLDASIYNVEMGEWDRVVAEYDRLEADALRQFVSLPGEKKDCYEELILFPIQAMANLHRMYQAQAKNLYLANLGDPDANVWADRVKEYFDQDAKLMAHYNREIAKGKWNGMMLQKHIGYTSWNDAFPHEMLPKTKRVEAAEGGFVFTPANGYISIEAEHYYAKKDAEKAAWTVIPYMGRTRSGLSLQPYTQPTEGAELEYRFEVPQAPLKGDVVPQVRVVTKSTLDYLNQGGLRYSVSIDGGEPQVVNFNARLNEKPENIYSIYYPTVARRIVEQRIKLSDEQQSQLKTPGQHTLTLQPLDPAIVFEKIVIDLGGYQRQYLFGEESPHRRP